MNIFEVTENKYKYLPLLLIADEQESMIDLYLNRGTMFALDDNGIKAVCVVTIEEDDVLELKNIAVELNSQNKGYGKKLIEHIIQKYSGKHEILQVGTGDSPLTIPFYESCGFHKSHMVKNFFVENYDHPIFENGKQLIDMIYLKRKI